MKHLLRVCSLLLTCLLLLGLIGCGGYNSNAVIYYEVDSVPATMDPQLASSNTELLLIRNLFEGLMRYDSEGNLVNGVIEDYTYENQVYTFTLKDNLCWWDGTELTADDFVFAFRRAVDPATKAPYASKLSSILNADLILRGIINASDLGVKAPDKHTFVVNMAKYDNAFLEKLATAVCMPCREKFFNECKGEYGLSKNCVLGNGSYKLTKWNTEEFAARILRNDYYFGDFTPRNSAIYFSYNHDKKPLDLLSKSSVDIAYIRVDEIPGATAAGLTTAQTDNVVWVMRFGDGFSYDLRRALITSIDRNNYAGDLGIGFNVAYTLFPESVAGQNLEHVGLAAYDIEHAKALFSTAVKSLDDKRFPTTTLLYYNDAAMAKPINDIVGHWQGKLGAYINIKPTTSMNEIEQTMLAGGPYIVVYPITISDNDPTVFVNQLGYTYTNQPGFTLANMQSEILSEYRLIPLAIQNSVMAYSTELSEFHYTIGNGMIDFSSVKKK